MRMRRKEYFPNRKRLHSEAPIRWGDLEEAANVMIAIINDYSADFDGALFACDTLNIDDLDVLLQNAKRGTQTNAN